MQLWIKGIALATLASSLMVGCSSTPVSDTTAKKVVVMHAVTASGVGAEIGTVTLSDGPQGLVISPNLKGLPSGERGFHIHENPSCQPAEKDGVAGAALAAGSHYNPHQVPNHGTTLTGHLGDLPALYVNSNGVANMTTTAPRLKLADVSGRALMIHAGGDNYSDHPQALGGGGARIACGLI